MGPKRKINAGPKEPKESTAGASSGQSTLRTLKPKANEPSMIETSENAVEPPKPTKRRSRAEPLQERTDTNALVGSDSSETPSETLPNKRTLDGIANKLTKLSDDMNILMRVTRTTLDLGLKVDGKLERLEDIDYNLDELDTKLGDIDTRVDDLATSNEVAEVSKEATETTTKLFDVDIDLHKRLDEIETTLSDRMDELEELVTENQAKIVDKLIQMESMLSAGINMNTIVGMNAQYKRR